MKKLFISYLTLMFTLNLHAFDTETIDGIEWTYEIKNGGAIVTSSSPTSNIITIPLELGGYPVTSIGDYAFYECSSLRSITIPDGVTSIDSWVFVDCTNLTSIIIPNTITNIGEGAFCGCANLTTIRLPDKLDVVDESVFENCSSLESIVIPDNVTQIRAGAFSGCSELISVIIPDSVVKMNCVENNDFSGIACGIFSGCSNLQFVKLSNRLKHVDDFMFENCIRLSSIEIPTSVTNIGAATFHNCVSLKKIDIPDSVTSIGSLHNHQYYSCFIGAFSGCTNLTTVCLSEKLEVIKEFTFENCSSLESIIIPDNVTRIKAGAFYGCGKLTTITIPASLQMMDITYGTMFYGGCSAIFQECEFLKEIFVKEDNMKYKDVNGILLTKNGDFLIQCPPGKEDVEIPEGVKEIEIMAFANSCIKSIEIPRTVTNIGYMAFCFCKQLKIVKAPMSLKKQVEEENVFAECNEGLVIEYYETNSYSDPIPELPSSATTEDIAVALGSSVDVKLAANITSATDYAAYRAWAMGLSNTTIEDVKKSPNAWLSFALDTEKLITDAPVEGDVTIDTFENAATDGAFEFTVNVKDITIGDGALEANIRKVFDIKGVEDLATGVFSANAVEVNAAVAENGKVKFIVMPKGESGGLGTGRPTKFFFKVKMK